MRWTAFLVIVSLVISLIPVGASAETIPSGRLTQRIIAKFDPYVTYAVQTGYVLSKVPKGAAAAEVEVVKAQLAKTNKVIAALRTSKASSMMESKRDGIGFSFQEGEITMLASTGGDIIWYWWGFVLILSHTAAQEWAYALNQTAVGTGLGAAILSAIPALGAVPGLIITGLATLGANAIAHADRGNGVRITFLAGGIPIGVSSL